MSAIPAWVGFMVAALIILGILLDGLGLLALEWLERRLSRKQRIAGTAALLILAVVVAVRSLVQMFG